MWIYLFLLALPVSTEINEYVRFQQLGTTVFKLFTPDHLSLEIDLHDYLLTAREYHGGIHYTRNCSRPVKVAFEKCGNTILETSFMTGTDNLTFQGDWIHHLIATLRKKCYNAAPDLMTITLKIFARADTNCVFTFTSVPRLEEKRKPVASFPQVHENPDTMEKTEVFKTDISSKQNIFTSSVLLETSLRNPVKVAIGKCGYNDPYNITLNVTDYAVLGTLNRLSALVCDLDRTHTFDTLIYLDPSIDGHFHYKIQDSPIKLFFVLILIPLCLIVDMMLLYFVTFHFIHRHSPVIVLNPVYLETVEGVPFLTSVRHLTPRMAHF